MLKNYVFLTVLVLSVTVFSFLFFKKPEGAPREVAGLEENLGGLEQLLPAHASIKFVNSTDDAAIPGQIAYILVPVILLPRARPLPSDTVLCIYPKDGLPKIDTLNFHPIWHHQYHRCALALYIPNKAG